MLKRIAARLFAPPTPQEDRFDRVAVATCVVLLEAARADSHFSAEERNHILDVLQARFQLSPEVAEELLSEAHAVRDESTDLWRFTNEINQHFSHAEKIDVVVEIWRIILSDGKLTGFEDHLAHKFQHLLNLNHPQLIEAKQKAARGTSQSGGST